MVAQGAKAHPGPHISKSTLKTAKKHHFEGSKGPKTKPKIMSAQGVGLGAIGA